MPATVRQSSQASKLPSLDEITPLARSLARRIAHRADDIDDLIQVAMFAYHTETAADRRRRVRNKWSLAKTILHRAMLSYYYTFRTDGSLRVQQQRAEWRFSEPIDLFNFRCRLDGQAEDAPLDVLHELADYFVALEAACGPTARIMIQNLLEPNDPCIAGYILAESRDKQMSRGTPEAKAIAKKGNFRKLPRGGGTSSKFPIPVTARRIQQAMGMSPYQWQQQMGPIQAFTREWLTRNSIRVASPTS